MTGRHPSAGAAVLAIALCVVRAQGGTLPEGAPSDQHVLISMYVLDRPYVTGDTVAAKNMAGILFLDAPCTLSLENTNFAPRIRYMRRAWTANSPIAGWYRLSEGDGSAFLRILANLVVQKGLWTELPRALLHTDGSATIVEPNYNSATFARTAQAKSPGRAVKVFAPSVRFVTGDSIKEGAVLQMLFTAESCSLPQYDAPDAHRAWQNLGAYQIGCWYATPDGGALLTDGAGHTSALTRYELQMFASGLLYADGSITITEPKFDSATAAQKAAEQQSDDMIRELRSHQNEQP
jgi:hypothetical protein